MAVNIVEAFLHDSEERQLNVAWKFSEVGRQVQRHGNVAALRETAYVPLQGRPQTNFIEKGWVQEIRHGADVAKCLINQRSVFLEPFDGFFAERRFFGKNHRQVHVHSGEQLPDSIMQLARNSPPLLILGFQQSRGETSELVPGLQQFFSTVRNAHFESEFSLFLLFDIQMNPGPVNYFPIAIANRNASGENVMPAAVRTA